MRIYIAGPYSGNDTREVSLNVYSAIKVACALIRKGHSPFIPHLTHYIWTHPDGDFSYEEWTRIDNDWLKVSDALFFIDHSPGADAELKLAKELGLKVYYKLEDVPNA